MIKIGVVPGRDKLVGGYFAALDLVENSLSQCEQARRIFDSHDGKHPIEVL
jgi:hypothetical protein